MHKYMIIRGCPNLIRRILEDLQNIYYPFINKKTKKRIGLLQLMPREVRTFELAFPETEKENIQKDVEKIREKHCLGQTGGVAVHWGPFKKDKFKDGVELI